MGLEESVESRGQCCDTAKTKLEKSDHRFTKDICRLQSGCQELDYTGDWGILPGHSQRRLRTLQTCSGSIRAVAKNFRIIHSPVPANRRTDQWLDAYSARPRVPQIRQPGNACRNAQEENSRRSKFVTEFGKGFRPIQKVQAAFATRPIPDEALCAVLWEYKDRGKKGYDLTERFFSLFRSIVSQFGHQRTGARGQRHFDGRVFSTNIPNRIGRLISSSSTKPETSSGHRTGAL